MRLYAIRNEPNTEQFLAPQRFGSALDRWFGRHDIPRPAYEQFTAAIAALG